MKREVDLALDDEERALADTTRRVLEKAAPHRHLTSRSLSPDDGPLDMWALALEMGWPGLLVPEAQGGLGLSLATAALVSEEMGRNLFCGAFSTTAILAPTLFGRDQERQGDVLARIASGDMLISLANVAPDGAGLVFDGIDPVWVSGSRDLIEHATVATHFLALHIARRPDRRIDLMAALVSAGGLGCRGVHRQPFDVTCPVARIDFDRAPAAAEHVLRFVLSEAELDEILRPLHVVVAAELVGIARAALERATAYAKDRQQFGAAIGSFQAIKHRLADGFIQVESAGLAVRQAALDGDAGSALAARALATEAALKTTGDNVQIHGGMGFSWECDAHLYFKRARRLAALLITPQELRRKTADRLIAEILGERAITS